MSELSENSAPGEIINILNPDDGKTYTVILSAEDSQRVQNDMSFAQQLLKNIRGHQAADNKEKVNEATTEHTDHIYWSYETTNELIKLFESKIEHLYNVRKRKNVFAHIANQLGCTPEQVQNKWKSLIRSYKSSKELKTKTGRLPSRFLFFNEMDKLMNTDAAINPLDSSDSSESDTKPPIKKIMLSKFEVSEAPYHHNWSFEATIALIRALEPYRDDILMLDNPKYRKQIFDDVANTLNGYGIFGTCTKIHVQNKWKGLLRSFKASQAHRQTSRRSSARFMYFDEMNKLIGDKIGNNNHPDANEDPEFEFSESSDSEADIPVETKRHKPSKPSTAGTANFNWTYKASAALIKSMKPLIPDLRSQRQRKNAFERVANELALSGYNCTSEQVHTKWDSLMKNYKAAKNKNDSSGREAHKCLFLKEMDLAFSEEIVNENTRSDTLNYLYEKEKNRQERHREKMEIEKKKISLLEIILEKLNS